jgi:hypothetical protein
MKDENKSLCWVDGKECPYHSGARCLKDFPENSCASCNRMKSEKELIMELVDDYISGTYIDEEEMGMIRYFLNKLKDRRELSKSDLPILIRIINYLAS